MSAADGRSARTESLMSRSLIEAAGNRESGIGNRGGLAGKRETGDGKRTGNGKRKTGNENQTGNCVLAVSFQLHDARSVAALAGFSGTHRGHVSVLAQMLAEPVPQPAGAVPVDDAQRRARDERLA